MALLKDLIVTGASKFIGDAYMNIIKSGTWNGSPIALAYGGTAGTTTANKLLLSTTTSGTSAWSAWTTAGFLKTNASGVVSVDTNTYLTAGGAATSANKLNTDAGSSTQPVYFSNGVPVACDVTFDATTTLLDGTTTQSITTDWATILYCSSTPTESGGTALDNGCYAIYIEDRASTTGDPNSYSGIFTLNSSGTRLEEIMLSASMTTSSDSISPSRIYVGILGTELQISGDLAETHYLTVKIRKFI